MTPFLCAIAFSALVALGAIASPVGPHYNSFQKRADPGLAWNNFTAKERNQLNDGMADAIQLAQYAVLPLLPGPRHDTTIFQKYFPLRDEAIVREIFLNVLGDTPVIRGRRSPSPQPHRPSILGHILIRKDFELADGTMMCDDSRIIGYLIHPITLSPQVVVCDRAFAQLGSLRENYRNGPARVTCESIGNRVSYRMDFLGSYLLQQYLFWDPIYDPPLHQHYMGNFASGPVKTRSLIRHGSPNSNAEKAKRNPNSYMWYALESMWHSICDCRNFEDPRQGALGG